MWAGQIELREAIDLATCAAADPATYLGAAINGLTSPTSNADLALMVALTRFAGEPMKSFIPIATIQSNESDTDAARAPEPDEQELAAAEAILDQTIIFA
ncbi:MULTISPECIES: hypothetical protein [Trueperella]|uniref:hypothetical protein n=1 Tax=Trueperella TaxID=1069494 RepID=UPI0008A39909|nr:MULTISPECIES: hypothetical protein [Trueperella]OFS67513.1 hypothetical protein HMPREF3174_03550 [Trueperella sp. HMSC08H06]